MVGCEIDGIGEEEEFDQWDAQDEGQGPHISQTLDGLFLHNCQDAMEALAALSSPGVV